MNIIGCCAGNGVMLYPFKKYLKANLEPRAIFHTKSEYQWFSNFSVPIYKDPELFRRKISDIDILLGHPDCGHSSMLSFSRAKKMSDPRDNDSLTLYFNTVREYEPSIWLMENLPALLNTYTRDVLREMFPQYELLFNISSVMDYGNSQKDRKRLVIIGLNSSFKMAIGERAYIKLKHILMRPYQVHCPTTCVNLLNGLDKENKEIGHVRENINSIITLYAGYKTSLREIQKFWLENPNLKRWLVKNRNFTTAPGVYRNLNDSYPSTARKANRQFNPGGLTLTPRELARIQGVPDDFILYVGEDDIQYWINKARATVTKCAPYEVGLWFYNVLINTIPNSFKMNP